MPINKNFSPPRLMSRGQSWIPSSLLLVLLSTFSGTLMAQSSSVPLLEQPVYQLTPVRPYSERESTSPAKLPSFSSSQPPFDQLVWQLNFSDTPEGQHSHSKAASSIQLVNHQAESVIQTNVGATGAPSVPLPTVVSVPTDSDAPAVSTASDVAAHIKKVEQSTVTDEIKAAANKHNQQSI